MPDYQVGDVVEASIITPVDLNVIDPEATKRLRDKAAGSMPPIFRYYPQSSAEVEADFRTAFRQERDRFKSAIVQCYHLEKLNLPSVNAPGFELFLDWVQKQNPNFPCPTNLVRAWALGQSGNDVLEDQLVPKLRQAMKQYIRPEDAIVDTNNSLTLTVFTAKPNEAIPELETLDKRSRTVSVQEVYTVSEARMALAKSFSKSEQALARFVAQFLKENCSYDPHLAERMLKRKTAGIWSSNRYTAGQLIVKSGDTVTASIKAALEALEEKSLSEQKEADAARVRDEKFARIMDWFNNSFALVLSILDNTEPVDYALWSALAGMLLVWYFVRRHRKESLPTSSMVRGDDSNAYTVILNPQRNETIFLPARKAPSVPALESSLPPAPPSPLPLPVPDVPRLTDAEWLERAREAEKRAEELLAMVRSGLAPHLAKELMNRLVQELIAQRSALLETQQLAAREITSIETRFNAISSQLQEQLTIYEKRTQELEGRLVSKEVETSEMLRAMIVTQKKLHSTQSGNSGAKD